DSAADRQRTSAGPAAGGTPQGAQQGRPAAADGSWDPGMGQSSPSAARGMANGGFGTGRGRPGNLEERQPGAAPGIPRVAGRTVASPAAGPPLRQGEAPEGARAA